MGSAAGLMRSSSCNCPEALTGLRGVLAWSPVSEEALVSQAVHAGLWNDGSVPEFPSMKASALLAVLMRKPLSYTIDRQKGSHRTLKADGRPQLLFSFHDGATVPPGLVRKYLVNDIGLSVQEALRLLGR